MPAVTVVLEVLCGTNVGRTTLIVPVWPGVTLLPVACKTEPAVSRITAGKVTLPFEGTSGPAPLIGRYLAGPVNTTASPRRYSRIQRALGGLNQEGNRETNAGGDRGA